MRRLKQLKIRYSTLLLSLFILALTASCEIGMGAAVDIAVPTVDISYPPKNAIVRDSFVVSGACGDDMGVTSVKVSLHNPETNRNYGPYEATLNSDKSAWTITLNNSDLSKTTNFFDSYKQWDFIDGNYIINAISYDANKKVSQAASCPISIDNTAPVLVVSKPLALGDEDPTIYGRSLKLSGDIAEDHDTARLVLYYRECDSSFNFTGQTRTVEITDSNELSAISSSNPLIIAKYENDTDAQGNPVTHSAQHEKYLDIYGSDSTNVDKYYYCGFLLEDNAKLYQTPGDNGSGTGNQTEQYYVLSDDFKEDLSVNYSLTAPRLKEILRGDSENYTKTQIDEISQVLTAQGNYAKSANLTDTSLTDSDIKATSSKFSLNPHNNPTWWVEKFGVTASTPSASVESYTAGSSIILKLKAGRDGSYPDPRTVDIKLYDLGTSYSFTTDLATINPDNIITIVDSTDPETKWDEAADDANKTYTFTASTEDYPKLATNHFYRLVVTGTDRNKTDLEPLDDQKFIFRLSTSNDIPKIIVKNQDEPDNSAKTWNDDKIYGTTAEYGYDSTNGITIRGLIQTDGVPLKDSADKFKITKVTVRNESDANSTPTQRSDIISSSIITLPDNCTTELSANGYDFTINLKANNFVPATPGKYFYEITLQAKDSVDLLGTKKIKFYVDKKKPELEIISLTPENGTEFVNGNITISGIASDSVSGLESLKYTLKEVTDSGESGVEGFVNKDVFAEGQTITDVWNIPLKTKDLTDGAANYKIYITAKDKAGNTETKNKLIKVNQEGDRPVLSPNTFYKDIDDQSKISANNNLFGITTNNKLEGTITDDDGIGEIVITSKKLPSRNEELLYPTSDMSADYLSAYPKTHNFKVALPAESGIYEIYIYVKDKYAKQAQSDEDKETDKDLLTIGEAESTENKPILIAVDSGAPVITVPADGITTTGTYSAGYYSGNAAGSDLRITGSATDENGVNSFTGTYTDTAIAHTLTPAAITTSATSVNFTDVITLPSTSGSYTATYTAIDIFGQTAQYPITYKVDVDLPTVEHIYFADDTTNDYKAGTYSSVITDNTLQVKAVVKDEHSGVKNVWYVLGNVDSAGTITNETNTDGTLKKTKMNHSTSEDNGSEQTWTANVNFKDTNKKITILVEDEVGLLESSEVTVSVDKTAPKLSFNRYQVVKEEAGAITEESSMLPSTDKAFVNNEKDLILYINYSDIPELLEGVTDSTFVDTAKYWSGVADPEFYLGGTADTNKIAAANVELKYYGQAFASDVSNKAAVTATEESDAKKKKSFTAKIKHAAWASATTDGPLYVSAGDAAGNKIDGNPIPLMTLEKDITPPTVTRIKFSKTDAAGNATENSVYNDTVSGNYYIRNTTSANDKFKISGFTSDTSGSIDRTEISIAGLSNQPIILTSATWETPEIDLSTLTTTSTTVSIQAYDKAGNKLASPLTYNIVFDNTSPEVLTRQSDPPVDANNIGDQSNPYDSDYYFRNINKDDSGNDIKAQKYQNIKIGGGKYSDSSYGRATSQDITVTFIKEDGGSGISKMEYIMLPSSKAAEEAQSKPALRNVKTGIYDVAAYGLPANGIKTGEFTFTDGTYTHYGENGGNPVARPCIVGTATIDDFESTVNGIPNILLVRATDNCGNEGSWFALIIQMDDKPSVAKTSAPESILTNGKASLPVLEGSFSEGYRGSGLKKLRVYIDGQEAIYGGFTQKPDSNASYGDKELYDALHDTNNPLTVTAKDKNGDPIVLSDLTDSEIYNKAVEVSFSNNYGTLTYKGYAPEENAFGTNGVTVSASTDKYSFKDAASYAEWKLELTPQTGSWFANRSNATSMQIAIEAEDWAEDASYNGNKSKLIVTNLDIDTIAPYSEITSPDKTKTLNGVQTIAGTVTEAHTPKSVAVYYTTADITADATKNISAWTLIKQISTEAGTDDETHKYGASASEIYSFEIEKDFSSLITGESGNVYILVCTEDKAGNRNVELNNVTANQKDRTTKAYERFAIDKDLDRPVVAIKGKELSVNASSELDVLNLDGSTLEFKITDDDDIESLTVLYRIIKADETLTEEEKEARWVAPEPYSSGEGTVRFTSEGEQTLEFKITDGGGNTFTSGNTEKLSRIKLKDMVSTPHEFGNDSVVITANVDINKPSLAVKKVQFLATENQAENTATWLESNYTDQILGGPDSKFIRIQLEAKDAGTKVHEVKISATFDKQDITVIPAGETEPTTVLASITNAAVTDIPDDDLYTLVIPSTMVRAASARANDSKLEVKMVASDFAGKTVTEKKTFKVDDKFPEITVTAPDSASNLSGATTLEGTVSETVRLEYAISPLSTSPESYDEDTEFSFVKNGVTASPVGLPTTNKAGTTTINPADDLYELCAYKPMGTKKLMSFYMRLDGDMDAASGVHEELLNTWLKNLGITNEADLGNPSNPFDDIVHLYFHLRATDAAGNSTEISHPIKIDPQGSRPRVSIGYPSAEKAGLTTTGLTLGGIPTIMGTASGTNAVDYVWLQVDCDEDGAWTAADFNTLLALTDDGTVDGNAVYALGDMTTKALVTTALANGADARNYGIRVDISGGRWSQKINLKGELNPPEVAGVPVSLTKEVLLWAYSTDRNYTSSPEGRKIIIDSGAPVIDQNIRLVQWNSGFTGANGFSATNGNITFADGALKANRAYSSEKEYIKGIWYVIGKVSDESGIKSITYRVNDETPVSEIKRTGDEYTNASNGTYVKKIPAQKAGAYDYIFCIPIGNDDDEAVGEYTIEFTAYENEDTNPRDASKEFKVLYDNKKPVIKEVLSDVEDISERIDIVNTDGSYTFGGIVTEKKENGNDQTGIDRIAFYFTRGTTTIFDPMIRSKKKVSNVLTPVTGNAITIAGSGLTLGEEGLYWKFADVSGVENAVLTLTSAVPVNVHVGGLAKVNGVIYRIDGIEAENKKITLSGDPGTASSVLFAIANVVDNPTNESPGETDITADDGYGYTSDVSYDDDDRMVESLVSEDAEYTWTASINSKNISDGPVVLHYVVFDKAGNFTKVEDAVEGSVTTINGFVKNNAPRLAGVILGTDENGNDEVDEGENGEFISDYSNKFVNGYDGKTKVRSITVPSNSTKDSPKSVFTVKGKTVIKPEIVGGNGNVSYSYNVSKWKAAESEEESNGWLNPYKTPVAPANKIVLGAGTETENENLQFTSGGIQLLVKDFLKNGIDDADNQKFSFTFWDETPGESQTSTLDVIMNVALNDNKPATNKIIPFYWKNKTTNSLDGGLDKGHIELSADLAKVKNSSGENVFATGNDGIFTLNPKVSGAIKLEGIASDNNVLGELWVTIDNGTPFEIARNYTVDAQGNKTYGSWTTNSGTGWHAEIKKATYGEYKAAGYITSIPQGKKETDEIPFVSQDYNHVVHWIMYINTETMLKNGSTTVKQFTPKANVEITVSAKDKGTPSYDEHTDKVIYTPLTFANNGDDNNLANVKQTGGELGNNKNVDNSNAKYTCKYTIDVVPYIRGFKTKLSSKTTRADSSQYDRTALGHYPVANTETVYVYGFNLEGGSLYDKENHSLYLGNANTTAYSGFTVYPTSTKNAANQFVNAPVTSFKSGPVYVKVGEIQTLNNLNFNDSQGTYGATVPAVTAYGAKKTSTTFSHFYNRKPNSQNNYSLTDDTELDVWNINNRAAKPAASGAIFDPVMKINPTGNGAIGFAYVSGTRRFSMANSNNSYQLWVGDYDNLSAASLTYDSAGNTYGTALGGDINSDFSNSKFAFMSSIWGPSQTDNTGTKGDNKHQRVEQIGQIGTKANTTNDDTKYIDKSRVLSPSIAVTGAGTSATVYLAYYDHMNQEIRFRWAANPLTEFKKKINNVDKRGFSGTCYINDGYTQSNLGSNGNLDKYQTTDFQIIAESGIEDTTSLGNAGQYVSIDVIPDGAENEDGSKYDVVVIAWYDKDLKNLMYTYNITDLSKVTSADFEGSAKTQDHWQSAQKIFTDAGMYCQIKVDGQKGIHFAAYDNDSGDVRYAKLASYNTTYDEETMSCIVDSNGIIGTNLTLDVALNSAENNARAIPYIGYYGSSGPKMAYLTAEGAAKATSEAAGALNDMFTGYWEVTEVPTQSNAVKDRINVGVWKTAAGVLKTSTYVATTHAGNGNTSDNGSTYGNGTDYPVLGYEIRPSTDVGFMETAQKQ